MGCLPFSRRLQVHCFIADLLCFVFLGAVRLLGPFGPDFQSRPPLCRAVLSLSVSRCCFCRSRFCKRFFLSFFIVFEFQLVPLAQFPVLDKHAGFLKNLLRASFTLFRFFFLSPDRRHVVDRTTSALCFDQLTELDLFWTKKL